MAIDFHAETERQRLAAIAEIKAASRPLAPMTGDLHPALSQPVAAAPVGSMTPIADWPKILHEIGATATMPEAVFPNTIQMWPILGRRSVLAVLRNAFLLIHGREPTLDECDRFLRSAIQSRWNAAELHYIVAITAGVPSPRGTLTARQLVAKAMASVMRRVAGSRLVPFRFTSSALALDSFVLDAMRLTSALAKAGDPSQTA